jgi:hypothetical protein
VFVFVRSSRPRLHGHDHEDSVRWSKRSDARRAKSDERRRTLVYAEAESDERNAAAERFHQRAAC